MIWIINTNAPRLIGKRTTTTTARKNSKQKETPKGSIITTPITIVKQSRIIMVAKTDLSEEENTVTMSISRTRK